MSASALSPASVEVVCDERLARRKPLVSVCILTYNQAAYIRDALDSVLRQEVDFEYEIIVGDDCSSDTTRAILRAYQQAHPHRIRLNLHKKRYGGIPGRENMVANLQAARGRYVALLDGDDYWISNDKLQRQTDFLGDRDDVTLSFHNAQFTSEISGESFLASEQHPKNRRGDRTLTVDDLVDARVILGDMRVPSSSMVFRRSLFDPVPDWYWHVWNGDLAMQLYFTKQGRAHYHQDLFCCRRQTRKSMTHVFSDSLRRYVREVEEVAVLCDVVPEFNRAKSLRLFRLYKPMTRMRLEDNDVKGAASCFAKGLVHFVLAWMTLPKGYVLANTYILKGGLRDSVRRMLVRVFRMLTGR
jgi:glycosyltransferase involved in cell wall biosynthesis